MSIAHNKYTVNQRIQDLQSRVLSLETDNKSLRAWVESELQTRINDARNVLRGQIRDGIDGASGKDGRDGVDGQSIVGPQGPQGDITVIGDPELREAMNVLRQKHAKFLAALQHARELNAQQPSEALKRALNSVLRTIESEANT